MVDICDVIDLAESDDECVIISPVRSSTKRLPANCPPENIRIIDLVAQLPQTTPYFDLSCDEDLCDVIPNEKECAKRNADLVWDCTDDTPIRLPCVRSSNAQNSTLSHDLSIMGFREFEILYATARCNCVESAIPLIMRLRDNAVDEDICSKRSFPCPICMDDCSLECMVTLSCLHRLCADCFSGFCSSKIADGEVSSSELCCPAMSPSSNAMCSTPISIHEIKAHVPDDIFEKYQKFQTRAFCEQQKMRSCPKCNEWYVDIADALLDERIWSKIVCRNCSHAFCGKCGLQPHKQQEDQDITCQALADWMEKNNKGDTSLSDYMEKNKLFPCPGCRMAAELSYGCKFLTCRCKCSFCALCGHKLTAMEHFTHFNGVPNATGPYGVICQGMRSATDVAVAAPAEVAAPPVLPAAPRKMPKRRRKRY